MTVVAVENTIAAVYMCSGIVMVVVAVVVDVMVAPTAMTARAGLQTPMVVDHHQMVDFVRPVMVPVGKFELMVATC